MCNSEAALVYLINLGCIDINPWTSRTKDYLRPDYVIIDLDPSDDDFDKVTRTALAAKEVFDGLKLKTFPKTSGKTGMHIYIPCAGISFHEARKIATGLATLVHNELPDITTTANTISKRSDKVFIDYNQNDEADTIAAPYSVRPASKPTVSTPLEWKEVDKRLRPENFTMENIAARLEKKGDLFKGVLDTKIALQNSKILKKLISF